MIGQTTFTWDGTRWVARRTTTATQPLPPAQARWGQQAAPGAPPVTTVPAPVARVSPVATVAAPAQPPTRTKPKQTDEEWFRDVPAAGGGAAAKARAARQRRVYG
ncbi:MAG TPA: hypothetical protein VMY35_13570, partial [Phycisphaerae bacterium]|nr:hypothetical protein [Phycisphaerae bacterium]